MFRRTKMTAAISQELIDELTEHGRRDPSQLRMDDLESEAYELVDAITRRAVWGVLEEQVKSCEMSHCPQCGRELDNKPPEEKTLSTQRGELTWNQPIKRCTVNTETRCDSETGLLQSCQLDRLAPDLLLVNRCRCGERNHPRLGVHCRTSGKRVTWKYRTMSTRNSAVVGEWINIFN